MDSVEKLRVGLPEVDGVIVKGFEILEDRKQTIRSIIESFEQTQADYKVCGIIYPVGTRNDRALVQFSNVSAEELILKIGKKTKLKIEKIKTLDIGQVFLIRIHPVVACLLPNLAKIQLVEGVKYVDNDDEYYFVSKSKESLQIFIDSIIAELRKTLLKRGDRVKLLTATPSSAEDHSDSSSSDSFEIISDEDVRDVPKHPNIVACSVVISIDSKICNWKDEVVKFLRNLKCEYAAIFFTAEDHAIAVFYDEKDANRLLTSQVYNSPIRCSRLNVPSVVDEGKLIRVKPAVSLLFPDIVKCIKQRWKVNVIILNDIEFITDFNQNILTELAEYVSNEVNKNYVSNPQSTSQMIDRESVQISTKPNDNSGAKLNLSDKKEFVDVGKIKVPINKSTEDVSEKPECAINEQSVQCGGERKDRTARSEIEKENADDQAQKANQDKDTLGKRRRNSQEDQTNQNKIDKGERDDVKHASQNRDTKEKRQDSQDHHTSQYSDKKKDGTAKSEIEKEIAGDHAQKISENKDTLGKRQVDSQDDHPSQNEMDKENRDDVKHAGQNRNTKHKGKMDSQDHHTSQDEIKKENRDDQDQQADQRKDTKGKRHKDSQDHHTSQSEIEKGNQGQKAGQNNDTKGKSQKDSQDHHTNKHKIEKENRDSQGHQAGQNKDINRKRQRDSQDHRTSQIEMDKNEGRDDEVKHTGENIEPLNKAQKTSKDHHTSQDEIEEENRDGQGQQADQNKDTKGKRQRDSQDHHHSQIEIVKENKDDQGKKTGQNKDTKDKKQKASQDDLTSQGKIYKDESRDEVKHAGQDKDTKDKRHKDSQDPHTSKSENDKEESRSDEVKHAGQSKDTKDKNQKHNTSKDDTSQCKLNTDNRKEYGQVKCSSPQVDTTGRGYTGKVKSTTDKRQEYGEAHGKQKEDENYRGWNKQDQETFQMEVDGQENQGNSQYNQTRHKQGNDGGKAKPTAEKKDNLNQSQKDTRAGYLTVHNEVYQFIKQFQEMRLKTIERNYNVNIKWIKNEIERNIAVLSNNDKDEGKRRLAENEFIQLYQDVSNNVKLQNFSVENHKSSDIKQSLKGTMQESKNVLLLHKDKNILFIGDENSVIQARKIFKRLLGIPVDEKRLKKSVKESEKSSGNSTTITVGKEIKVIIKQADITSEDVDVIVNAANSRLQHDGGVAKAIAVKAGRSMDVEGQRKLNERRGCLNVSDVLHTSGYNLNAKFVLHAVGPMQQHVRHSAGIKPGKHDQFYHLLKVTFLNCLEYADEKLKAKSIAVPLISSGNFGGGKRECAKALATSVNDFVQINKLRNLKEIRLVNIDAEATQEIQSEVDAILEFIPRSQNSAVSGNMESGSEQKLPIHPIIEDIDLSHAVLVEGFEIYESEEKTKLNLVMFLPEFTNGRCEVQLVIYPVERLPKKAVVIFSEQEVAKCFISHGKSTTKHGKNLQFNPIEVGHHWEAIILDMSLIYPSNLLNRLPARFEDLSDGRLLFESQESAQEVETYVNGEFEKWFNTEVDGLVMNSGSSNDVKGKFSESQCVIVTGFKIYEGEEQTRDKLEIVLTKQKNGGGDVEQIVYPFENSASKALVIFYETEVANSLIEAKKIADDGQSLKILPFKKRIGTSQCVIVRGFTEHETIERTSEKLQIILQKRQKGGGDVEKIVYPFLQSANTAVAIFSKTEVASSLISAQIISDDKGQNLKVHPLKVCHQMKTFILELGGDVVQLDPTLKDHILRANVVKGRFLKDGWKLMLDEEDDILKVYKHVSDRIKGLLSSYLLRVSGEDNSNIPPDDLKRMAGKSKQTGSAESQQIDRPEFLIYQLFKNCHNDKVKRIERTYDVTITWTDKHELAVKSNKPGNDTDRKQAEERFGDLYQEVHPKIKPLQLEDVHLLEAQRAKDKTSKKYTNVLILPKEYLFIGNEENVKQALNDFKCEITKLEGNFHHNSNIHLDDVEYRLGVVIVIIRLGDITNENVDVIVNAANGDLQHGSGVAKAIATKAGRAIHDEGQRLLKKRRRGLNVSEVLHTNGYYLKAKYVLHAVGPRHGKDQPFQGLLKKTFLNILKHADEILEARSIAIPLISSGVFGGNKEECAELLCKSICQFVQSEKCQNLKTISLVNIDVEATTAIQDMFQKFCRENWGQSYQATNAHSLQTRLASSTLPRDEKLNFYSEQKIHSSQASVHQNTHSEGQRYRIRDASSSVHPFYDKQNKINIKQEQSSYNSMQLNSGTTTHKTGSVAMKEEEEKCSICLEKLTEPVKKLTCGHKFCQNCIEKALEIKPVCPVCGKMFGALKGNQPKGKMDINTFKWNSLPGFEGCGTIMISYNIPSGTQTSEHPHPGKHYTGTTRIAYLPDNKEGRHVASLLRKAFDAQLIFTIGTSITTGAVDCVTWNDIHHKTNTFGGPNNYGYPDPNYLKRVCEELAAKGIK